jgi:hypothetical protein
MPTMDNARDLIELFQKEHKEYVIIIVQPGKKKKIHTFYKVDSEDTARLIGNSLHYVAEQIMGSPPQGSNDVIVEKPRKNK